MRVHKSGSAMPLQSCTVVLGSPVVVVVSRGSNGRGIGVGETEAGGCMQPEHVNIHITRQDACPQRPMPCAWPHWLSLRASVALSVHDDGDGTDDGVSDGAELGNVVGIWDSAAVVFTAPVIFAAEIAVGCKVGTEGGAALQSEHVKLHIARHEASLQSWWVFARRQ